MKALFVLTVSILSILASTQALAISSAFAKDELATTASETLARETSIDKWVADLIRESETSKVLVETIALAQSYDGAPITCDFKNLTVLSLKAALNSSNFKVRVTCKLTNADSTLDKPILVTLRGSIEDSQVFPARLEVSSR